MGDRLQMHIVEPITDGTILHIRAQPGARRNGVVGIHNERLKVAVTQVAERGKANDAILDVLADELDLRRSQLELVSGATNREKTILVRNMDVAELSARIDTLVKSI